MTIPMPEPVAYFYQWELDKRKSPYPMGVPVLTYTEAEAYAAAKVREALEWQIIETAPKDGTPVLLFARLESATASTRVVGAFIQDEWLAQSYVGQGKAVLVPSHWMPLPAPPLPGPVEPTT